MIISFPFLSSLVVLAELFYQVASSPINPYEEDSPSRCSGYYSFRVHLIDVIGPRSASQDTIYVSASVSVGSENYTFTKYYGRHGTGSFDPGISFSNIPIGDEEAAVLSYIVVNDGYDTVADENVEYIMGNSTATVSQIASKLILENPQQAATEVIQQSVGATFDKVVGFIIKNTSWTLDLSKHDCDGWLAAAVHGFRGSDICNGNGTIRVGNDSNHGDSDQELFGFIPGVISSVCLQCHLVW
jgi:hypothetical protein